MRTEQLERLHAALAARYAIERELGRGGMATVSLADDVKHHRQVAIKVLRPELASVVGSDRFLREVAIAARLNHHHILALHDSGEVRRLRTEVPAEVGHPLARALTRVPADRFASAGAFAEALTNPLRPFSSISKDDSVTSGTPRRRCARQSGTSSGRSSGTQTTPWHTLPWPSPTPSS